MADFEVSRIYKMHRTTLRKWVKQLDKLRKVFDMEAKQRAKVLGYRRLSFSPLFSRSIADHG